MTSIKRPLALTMTLAAMLLGSACGSDDTSSGGSSETVDMLLPFPDSVIFAGYEIARSKYYPDLGVDPKTQAVNGNSYTIQQLAAGQVPFALSGAPELIVAASKGHDLVSIASINKDMFAIGATEASGVTDLSGLKGKKLGIVDVGDGAMPLVTAALKDAGLVVNEDVELVVIGDGGPASLAAIKADKVDAYAASVVDLAVVEQGGVAMTSILPEKYKGIPNNELVVTRDTLNDPERLEQAINVAAGWFKGTLYASEDQAKGLDAVCEVVPADCQDREMAESLMATAVGLEIDAAEALGAHDLEKYELVKDVIVDDSQVGSEEVDLEAIFSNDYVDEIKAAMQ